MEDRMVKRGERIMFLVFRELDGRWIIVGEYTVETMAKQHLADLHQVGCQAGIIRFRSRPTEER
jgi:hypothetical protein